MKKVICVLLLLCCVILASCGKQQPEPEKTTESTTEYVIDEASLLTADAVAQHDCSVHGHVYSKATCQKAATCYYCGDQTGELGAHDWTHATCLKRATCTVCGIETGSYTGHRFTTATCAGPSSCAVCGLTTGSTLAHKFRAATCVTPSMCSVCLKTTGSALGHIWTGGGSCTEDQVCTRCKRHLTAPGHQMTGGSCTQDAVCSVCGYTEKAKGHQYVDGVCTVCGKTEPPAQNEDATRPSTTVSVSSTEVETTMPPIDIAALTQYGEAIRAHLQAAHDDADASISASAEEGRALAQSATENLRAAQTQIDEAFAMCKADARLKAASDALNAVSSAIRKSAAVTTFYDATFLKTVTTIRADSTKGLDALKTYEKAVQKLS